MNKAISETNRRRKIQEEYNKKHGITPKTIIKSIKNTLQISSKTDGKKNAVKTENIPAMIENLKAMMRVASAGLDFEKAIELREEIAKLSKKLEKNGKK